MLVIRTCYIFVTCLPGHVNNFMKEQATTSVFYPRIQKCYVCFNAHAIYTCLLLVSVHSVHWVLQVHVGLPLTENKTPLIVCTIAKGTLSCLIFGKF